MGYPLKFLLEKVQPLLVSLAMTFGTTVALIAVGGAAFHTDFIAATLRNIKFVRSPNKCKSIGVDYQTNKYFSNEVRELEKYDKFFTGYDATAVHEHKICTNLKISQNTIFSIATTAAMLWCSNDVMGGKMTVGHLVLAGELVFQLSLCLNDLACIYFEARWMFELLKESAYVKDKQDAKPLQLEGRSILFDNVHFCYPLMGYPLKFLLEKVQPLLVLVAAVICRFKLPALVPSASFI